jgi:hypothetical protein
VVAHHEPRDERDRGGERDYRADADAEVAPLRSALSFARHV